MGFKIKSFLLNYFYERKNQQCNLSLYKGLPTWRSCFLAHNFHKLAQENSVEKHITCKKVRRTRYKTLENEKAIKSRSVCSQFVRIHFTWRHVAMESLYLLKPAMYDLCHPTFSERPAGFFFDNRFRSRTFVLVQACSTFSKLFVHCLILTKEKILSESN